MHRYATGFPRRIDFCPRNVIRRALLDKDGLPDPGKRPVPALLAEWYLGERSIRKFVRVIDWAVDLDPDLVAALDELLGRVKRKRQKSPDIHAEVFAVYPDARDMEHSAEVQKQALAFPSDRDVELAAVDAGAASYPQISELGLPRPRYGNLPPFDRPRTIILDEMQKTPCTVERDTEPGWRLET